MLPVCQSAECDLPCSNPPESYLMLLNHRTASVHDRIVQKICLSIQYDNDQYHQKHAAYSNPNNQNKRRNHSSLIENNVHANHQESYVLQSSYPSGVMTMATP